MGRKTWLAVQEKRGDKFYAYALGVSCSDNLVSLLDRYGIFTANICESKKRAEDISEAWNNGYKASGSYLYT